jgi:hypothetical protein
MTKGRELEHIQRLRDQIKQAERAAKEVADEISKGWQPVFYNLQIAAHMLNAYAKTIQTCTQGIKDLEKDLKS